MRLSVFPGNGAWMVECDEGQCGFVSTSHYPLTMDVADVCDELECRYPAYEVIGYASHSAFVKSSDDPDGWYPG